MRAFLWLLTCAMGIFCFTCWFAADFAMSWFNGALGAGADLPGFTELVLRPHRWLLFVPIPWVIYSTILSARKDLSARAALIFAGTVGIALALVFCCLIVAGLLPLFPLKIVR